MFSAELPAEVSLIPATVHTCCFKLCFFTGWCSGEARLVPHVLLLLLPLLLSLSLSFSLLCHYHDHYYYCYSQDGGCWINLGPLLFHWADAHTYLPEEELSIELSLEEVEAAAKLLGFKTIKREMVSAAYMTNLRYVLLCFAIRLTLQLCFLLFRLTKDCPLQQLFVLHMKHTKVQA